LLAITIQLCVFELTSLGCWSRQAKKLHSCMTVTILRHRDQGKWWLLCVSSGLLFT